MFNFSNKGAYRSGLQSSFSKFLLTASATCLLTACGGGSSSTPPASPPPPPPAGDTQPPAIAFTASKTNPEGGETVILNADVTDNVDTGLSASLTCDGGTLREEFLTLPNTATAQTVNCTATATDAAGNTASQSLQINVTETITSLSTFEEQSDFKPNEIVIITAKNLDFDEATLDGELGGEPITFTNLGDNALSFVMPSGIAEGETIISFEVDSKLYNIPITVLASENVSDPTAYLNDYFARLISDIDNSLANPNNSLSDDDRNRLESERQSINDARESLSNYSNEHIQEAADFFLANAILSSDDPFRDQAKTSNKNPLDCLSLSRAQAKRMIVLATLTYATAAGTTVAAPNPLIAAVIGGIGVGILFSNLSDNSGPQGIYNCIFDNADDGLNFNSGSSSFKTSAANVVYAKALYKEEETLKFALNADRPFTLTIEKSLTGEAADIFFGALEKFRSAINSLPIVPDFLSDYLNGYEREISESFDGTVSLSNITNGAVSGDLKFANTSGTLAFDYNGDDLDQLDEGEAFSFTLNATSSGESSEVISESFEGLLTATPSAENAMVFIQSNEPTRFDVPAFGSKLEITSQPQRGRVEIIDRDTLQYTYEGEDDSASDELGYTALLGDRRAEDATVFINVEVLPDRIGNARPAFPLRSAFISNMEIGAAEFASAEIEVISSPSGESTVRKREDRSSFLFTYAASLNEEGGNARRTEILVYRVTDALGFSQVFRYDFDVAPIYGTGQFRMTIYPVDLDSPACDTPVTPADVDRIPHELIVNVVARGYDFDQFDAPDIELVQNPDLLAFQHDTFPDELHISARIGAKRNVSNNIDTLFSEEKSSSNNIRYSTYKFRYEYLGPNVINQFGYFEFNQPFTQEDGTGCSSRNFALMERIGD